jgi:hypothetical protein
MPEVIIDGIEYVPITQVKFPNDRVLKLAMLCSFWGDASNSSDEELDRLLDGLTIIVTDSEPRYEDAPYTMDSFLRDVAWFQSKEKNP